MFYVKQNESTAARKRVPIYLVDATDGYTPEIGVTAPTIEVSKNGGAQAAGTGTFTEIGDGAYYYEFAAGEIDTLGWVHLRVVKSGTSREYNAIVHITALDAYDSVRLGLSSLPNAAAEAAGGLITRGTGTGQLSVSGGRANADVTHIATAAVNTAAAQLGVNVVQISGDATAADNLEAAADGTGYNLGGGSIVAASVTGAVGSVAGNVGGNVAGSVAWVTAGVTVSTNNDKTGYALSAPGVDAIWDEAQSGHTTNGTFGKYLDAAISGVSTGGVSAADIADAVCDEALSGHTTSGTVGQALGRLDVTVSSRSSHSASDAAAAVWASGTRTLTGFGTLVADVATAVWAAGTRTLTSFGSLVSSIWSNGTRTLTSGGGGGGTTTLFQTLTPDERPPTVLRKTAGDENDALTYELPEGVYLTGSETITFIMREQRNTGAPDIEAAGEIVFVGDAYQRARIRFVFDAVTPVPAEGVYDAQFLVDNHTFPAGWTIPVRVQEAFV